MPFVKGKSGNPNGTPGKKRLLTKALETALSKRVIDDDGTGTAGKRWLAERIVEGLHTGKVTLDTVTIELSPQDWIAFSQWVYKQVDGPPPQDVEHQGSINIVWGMPWEQQDKDE